MHGKLWMPAHASVRHAAFCLDKIHKTAPGASFALGSVSLGHFALGRLALGRPRRHIRRLSVSGFQDRGHLCAPVGDLIRLFCPVHSQRSNLKQ
jgi:hypothetical protein